MRSAVPQPRPLKRQIPLTWWLGRWNYTWFILRELSSAFVAWWVIVTLMQIAAVLDGPQAYAAFAAWMAQPILIIVNLISLIFVLFHTVSWFRLVPQAMLPRIHGQRTSAIATGLPMYVIWAVASAIVACFALGVF